MTLKQARQELQAAGVLPHRIKLALNRLRALRAFWAAGVDASARNLTSTRERIAAELTAKTPGFPVTKHTLENWELMWKRSGMVGLAGTPGNFRDHTKKLRDSVLEGMAIGELADYALRVVNVLASRAKRDSSGDCPGP